MIVPETLDCDFWCLRGMSSFDSLLMLDWFELLSISLIPKSYGHRFGAGDNFFPLICFRLPFIFGVLEKVSSLWWPFSF